MRVIYLIIGLISLALGTIGTIVPLLPTVPFYLLAAFCLAKSSKRLHDWFTSTNLYKNNLDSYVKGEGMTLNTKIKIMVTVTLLMTIGFIMMNEIRIGQMVLLVVWMFHIYYFCIRVKTIK